MARSHRRAYGAHRTMNPAMKARNIAASILAHAAEGRTRTWSDYGITENPELVALVVAELHKQAAIAA